ncbi:aspartic peptidase domain-containing protein [Xylariales sp. PMI_506]|nr:aspartic peptidase domain-containing protein [Xylariales sp. PMI_506]
MTRMLRLLQLVLAVGTFASAVPETSIAGGYLSAPIARAIESGKLDRRTQNTDATLWGLENPGVYLIPLDLGSPPQRVWVQLDSGSSVLWVNPICSTLGPNYDNAAGISLCEDGSYDPSDSSTAKYPLKKMGETTITYGGGANVSMKYATDVVGLGGTNIKLTNVTIGVAIESYALPMGILGVSYSLDPVNSPNFIDLLQSQGVTSTKAYSIGIGSIADDSFVYDNGTVVFGGVDTMKFEGPLHRFPIQEVEDAYKSFYIELQSVSLTQAGSAKTYANSSVTVQIDSGSTTGALPGDLLDDIFADLNGFMNKTAGYYQIPCSERDNNSTFGFAFNNLTVQVPIANFITQASLIAGGASSELCGVNLISVEAAGTSTAILGDAFLSTVYAVFDQDNEQVLMAPARNCGSKIVALTNSMLTSDVSIIGECNSTATTTGGGDATATTTGGGAAATTTEASNAARGVTVTNFWVTKVAPILVLILAKLI